MKHTKIILTIIALFIFLTTNTAVAQNANTPIPIDVLKARKDLLKETTKLNQLKIKLSDLMNTVQKQQQDLQKANDRSTNTAIESKSLSTKASANVGDKKLANKASRTAKTAYSDARKVQKLTNSLNSNHRKIKSYESDIEKLRIKIEQMDQQLKFSENIN